MGWGNKVQSLTAASVAGTELFSAAVILKPGENSHIQIIGNSNGTTDNLVIAIYGTLDDSTQNYDTVAMTKIELDCTDGNDNDISIMVSGVYSYRVGCVRSGASDTITTNIYYRKDGVGL